jgi:hypothetical protein
VGSHQSGAILLLAPAAFTSWPFCNIRPRHPCFFSLLLCLCSGYIMSLFRHAAAFDGPCPILQPCAVTVLSVCCRLNRHNGCER